MYTGAQSRMPAPPGIPEQSPGVRARLVRERRTLVTVLRNESAAKDSKRVGFVRPTKRMCDYPLLDHTHGECLLAGYATRYDVYC